MPQDSPDVNHWELNRETVDLIPLTIETQSASGVWSETIDYDVQCVRLGSRPASGDWENPTTIGGFTGFLMDGPDLDPDQIGGDFLGFYRLTVPPEDSIEDAFTLKLK